MYEIVLILMMLPADGTVEAFNLGTYSSNVQCFAARDKVNHQTEAMSDTDFELSCMALKHNFMEM